MKSPSYDQVLQFVKQKDRPFVKTSEVAERFSTIQRRTVFNRLDELNKRGDLIKYKVTDNAVVWYTPDQVSSETNASSPASDSQ